MNWVFISIRAGTVEEVRVFDDYWLGEEYADSYLNRVFGVQKDFPEYRQGISYSSNGLSVGLYKETTSG